MASSGEIEQVAPTGEEDGTAAEGTDAKESKKSRKFKPFEAMRKLFKGNRKRTKSKDDTQISEPSGKSKSTTALMTAGSLDDDDEDSDGGFKSHQTKTKLQDGKRSISEDSVFTPGDTRDTSISALKNVAVSEENIHKNAFQNELFSKLKKRHSQYSDEDDPDPGLPQSPVPPVTTADVLGGSLKPHPGKSSSRESEKSLISVDSSDNEMDDMLSRWSSPGKPRSRSSDQSPPPDKSVNMDFEVVQPTHVLTSEAAKHKRSVKPQKRSQRASRKERKTVNSMALPSLNEESPTKVQNDDNVFPPVAEAGESMLTVTSKPGSSDKPTVTMTSTSKSVTVTQTQTKSASETVKTVTESSKVSSGSSRASIIEVKKDVPAKKDDVKKETITFRKDSVPAKKEPVPTASVKPAANESDLARGRSSSLHVKEKEEEKPTELSAALNKLKRRSMKDDLAKEAEKLELDKVSSASVKADEKSVTKSVAMTTVDVRSSTIVEKSKETVSKVVTDSKQFKPDEPKSALRKVEDGKPTAKPEESKSVTLVEKSDKHVSKTVVNTGSDVKHTINKDSSLESNKDEDAKSDTSSVKSDSFRSESGYKLGPAAKEEYKMKRQNRSKTLPEQPQLPEEFSAKVQRAKSQRSDISPLQASGASPGKAPYSVTSASKKMEPKRISLHEATPVSTEPEWMAAIRKRKAGETAESKPQEPKKDVMSTSAKDIVIKESEKPVDRMSKSFTAGSTTSSSSAQEVVKPEVKKESFTINTSRATSVKAPSKTETKTESTPVRYGSVKNSSKQLNIVTSSANQAKTAPTTTAQPSSTTAKQFGGTTSVTQSSSVTSKFGGTTSTTSKSFSTTSSSSSTRPDSISQTGASKEPAKAAPVKEVSKEPVKISPTEEAKKVFSRGQSVKTVTSSSESSNTPSRSSSVKSTTSSVKSTSSSIVKPATAASGSSAKAATSSVAKGSVQTSDSSSDRKDSAAPSSVPAWRSGLTGGKANTVHIEIIEKEPKQEPVQMRKKTTPPVTNAPTPADDSCRDSSANRSSKVLDMVKNFQKLQVS